MDSSILETALDHGHTQKSKIQVVAFWQRGDPLCAQSLHLSCLGFSGYALKHGQVKLLVEGSALQGGIAGSGLYSVRQSLATFRPSYNLGLTAILFSSSVWFKLMPASIMGCKEACSGTL